MSSDAVKRFSTLETLSLLLAHRQIMFSVIKILDQSAEHAISKSDFYRVVGEYQLTLSREDNKTVSLVFDLDNLLQSKILNDLRVTNNVTKLFFNTAIIDVFRLCEISLFRPLTSIALKAAMTPLWSIQAEFDAKHLSVSRTSLDYREWTAEIIHRIAELIGTIRGNIAKLERKAEMFEQGVVTDRRKVAGIDTIREQYQQANSLYEREIKPLSIFLNKDTRYEAGDGIYLILNRFCASFESIGDNELASLMNGYQIQCLDLFGPIKKVSSHVHNFLQKTKESIAEHTAIEKAYQIIRSAYEDTLSADQRNKFIKIKNLSGLVPHHSIHGVARLSPMRLERTPAFINVVLDELASRKEIIPTDEERGVFEESVNTDNRLKLEYQEQLEKWISAYEWPHNVDFVQSAVNALESEFTRFTLPDIFIVIARVIKNTSFNVEHTGRFNVIENDEYKVRYKVRFITSTVDVKGIR